MSANELKLLSKIDEIVVGMLEHFQGYGQESGDFLMAAIKFAGSIQNSATRERWAAGDRMRVADLAIAYDSSFPLSRKTFF